MNILGIDIGGTGLKAAVIDPGGQMISERAHVATPHPCPPKVLLGALERLVADLPEAGRIAVAFPGVVRGGRVLTAPNLGTEAWAGFDLGAALSQRLGGRPVRAINDAEMQGLAVIRGNGLEMILTLGTGAGTGLFRDGEVMPHLELAHHPIRGDKTYDEYLGLDVIHRIGRKRWNRRVGKAIELLRVLVNYDHLYIGGGNARHIRTELPETVTIVSNEAGLDGGAALWRLPHWK